MPLISRDTCIVLFVSAFSSAGAAAQSVWETGLVTPANAALASVLCAIVIHEPRRH